MSAKWSKDSTAQNFVDNLKCCILQPENIRSNEPSDEYL